MKDDENPGLIYEAEDGPDPLHCSQTPLVLIHDGGGTCFSCTHPLISITPQTPDPVSWLKTEHLDIAYRQSQTPLTTMLE